MGILKQVNKLAEKITGTNPKKREISQTIEYITDNYSNGGNGTSSSIFLINITFSEDGKTATLETPFADIMEAYQNNRILMISGEGLMSYRVGIDRGTGGSFVQFMNPYVKDANGGTPWRINSVGWMSIYIREDMIRLYYTDYEEPEA